MDFDNDSRTQMRAIGTGGFDFEKAVSGKSIVSQAIEPSGNGSDRRNWPYSFTEYLRRHIGYMVRVEHAYPNGQRTGTVGRLKIVGTDFVGLSLPRTGGQLLIGLSSITGITVLSRI